MCTMTAVTVNRVLKIWQMYQEIKMNAILLDQQSKLMAHIHVVTDFMMDTLWPLRDHPF